MEEKTAIDITDHDDILKRASVPCISSVFILGHGARQVTIHSQQVRALKLLWALDRKSWLAGKRVVIIGGGIAGVTAASAALVLGANVTLLERGEELLHLQRGCHTRYLHPHIYEWPASTARRASADLPIVNWTVGKASDVATQILADYRRIRSRLGAAYRGVVGRETFIEEITNARDVQIDSSGTSVSWRGKRSGIRPHAIILAVGFGVEKTVNNLPCHLYWRVDSLTQTALDNQDDNYVCGLSYIVGSYPLLVTS